MCDKDAPTLDDNIDEYADIEDERPDPRLFSDMPDDRTTEMFISLYQDGIINARWNAESETTKMELTKKGRYLAEHYGDASPAAFEAVATGDTLDPSAFRNLRGEDS